MHRVITWQLSGEQPRDLRSFSPMYHWTEHNIRVHMFTCVLTLQVAHLMRLTARRAGLDLSVRAALDGHDARYPCGSR